MESTLTLNGCENCIHCPVDAKKGDKCPAGVTRSWSVDFGVVGNWYIDGAAKECEKFEMKVMENDEIGFYSLFRNYTPPQPTDNALYLYQKPTMGKSYIGISNTYPLDFHFQKIPMNEIVNDFAPGILKISDTREGIESIEKMNLLASYVRKMKHSKNKHVRKLYKEKIIVEFGFDVDVKKKVS